MMDGALALAILPKIWSKIKGSNDKTEPTELSDKKYSGNIATSGDIVSK